VVERSKKRTVRIAITGVLGLAAAVIIVPRLFPSTEYSVYRAWYAASPTPSLIVELSSFTGPVSTGDPRRDQDAKTTTTYHSHRIDDGTRVGGFKRAGWTIEAVVKDRVWACSARAEPLVLAAGSLTPLADRSAIREAIAAEVGGDFEIKTGHCYVHPYTGHLAVYGADGKRHWVTTAPAHEAHTTDAIVPQGWTCHPPTGLELIDPRLVLCMAPGAGPNQLVVSRASALAKDANKPGLLSGVIRGPSDGRVVWTKSMADLTGQPDPFWLGAHALDSGKVVVLVRTGRVRVHVIELDPATGAVITMKILFEKTRPGA